MTIPDSNHSDGGNFATNLRLFFRDFASFAGRKGVFTVIFVALGAVLEGLSLVLIVPLLAIVIGSGLPSGGLERAAAAMFHLFQVERPLGKLTVLLALFGALMIVRAVVIFIRDVNVAALQAGFVEAQRLRIAERLAAAQWDQVVRLRHARITHIMSGDIQRISMLANFMLQIGVSVAMLLAQCILVVFLAPVLASLAIGLLVVSVIVFVPAVRRARLLGGIVTAMETLRLQRAFDAAHIPVMALKQ